MRLGGHLHRFWLAYMDFCVTVGRFEVTFPAWPWRLYCAARGHRVVDDQCRRPEHQYCALCSKATPGAGVTCP